ncbi:hypothetical protein [Bacillus sp. FJAT-50079]|uniref:hypothetical protein n=1 Tax=Bacillus sp. FJAT-50079 TaxID=2833577 RepID=UPI001BC9B2A3|nr:hypothetical protein [Bacillus sp. FJAT-50079]MBS4207486.1 hypothetical protein [Bacillus sp. FJAT-50079]
MKKSSVLTDEALKNYYELYKKKKEIDEEMDHLKRVFHTYFDDHIGANHKGEITLNGYKLQRQIRKMEKYHDETTIKRLEDLNMHELIQTIKKPDATKIKSALSLGLLREEDLDGCIITTLSPAISVKPTIPK